MSAASSSTPITVLVVDNNAAIRRLIANVLAPLMPQIVECDDGAAALAAYEAHRPGVVLMDIEMAHIDGIAATKAIRAAHPDARILIVTNYDSEDLRKAASGAGASAYVLKENLLELVPLLTKMGF